jgi:hypothetical protein
LQSASGQGVDILRPLIGKIEMIQPLDGRRSLELPSRGFE